jgi:flagellar biosynthetic protein FlhB
MSEEDDSEKSHDPSQKRLDDARARGEVAYSADLTTALTYAGFIIVAGAIGTPALISFSTALSMLLADAADLSTGVFDGDPRPLFGRILVDSGLALFLWVGVPAACAILSIAGQQGLSFAASKLAVKGSRISPLAALKSKFGLAGFVEFFKNFLKLCLYSAVLSYHVLGQLPDLISTLHLSPALATVALGRFIFGVLMVVLLVAGVLGVLDLIWQRLNHLRKNRMSRQELIEEMKESEGDPHFKQQRRQRGTSIAMNQMLADVPKASVVIVNPTHYAVALLWDRSTRRAPICVAKGTDEIAARIRELAQAHAIPIQSDPPTARALFADTEIGQEVSRTHYRAVAAAIRFAERIRNRKASRS